MAQWVKNPPAMQETQVRSLGWEDPGLGRGEHGNPLQYSCVGNRIDRGAWWATIHRVTKSQTRVKRLSIHAHNIYFFDVYIFKLFHMMKQRIADYFFTFLLTILFQNMRDVVVK